MQHSTIKPKVTQGMRRSEESTPMGMSIGLKYRALMSRFEPVCGAEGTKIALRARLWPSSSFQNRAERFSKWTQSRDEPVLENRQVTKFPLYLQEVFTLITELMSVGTELLLGEITDTNAAFLANDLKGRGVTLHFKTTVGDNLTRVVSTLKRALERSDLVILGGGLGPTDDDLTREAIAEVLGEIPLIDEVYLEQLRGFFLSRGRTFPEQNVKQAWILPSGEALPNPVGTAPGWLVRPQADPYAGKIIIALPGPPREMKPMWLEQAIPRLNLPQSGFYHRTFRTFGIGESHIAEKLGELTQMSNPSVATYARRDGVHVRVAALSDTLEEAKVLAGPVEETVQMALEGYVYGTDDQTLPKILGGLLGQAGQTLSVLESMTGGLVLDELSNESGSSAWLQGGAVAYTQEAKARFGVGLEDESSWVSAEAALEMALKAKAFFGSDWAISTTGVAGPETLEGKPIGTLFVGIAGPNGAKAFETVGAGDRRTLKERSSISALGLFWRVLLNPGVLEAPFEGQA